MRHHVTTVHMPSLLHSPTLELLRLAENVLIAIPNVQLVMDPELANARPVRMEGIMIPHRKSVKFVMTVVKPA